MKINVNRIFEMLFHCAVVGFALLGVLAIYIYVHRIPDKQDKAFEQKLLYAFAAGQQEVFACFRKGSLPCL
jgi:hypothetical protein